MAKITLARERLHVPIRLATPFSGELPVPDKHHGQAYVLLSVAVSHTCETYGRRVVIAVAEKKVLDVPLDVGAVGSAPVLRYVINLPACSLRILLSRAVLLPPTAQLSVHVTGTDGAPTTVVLEGLFTT